MVNISLKILALTVIVAAAGMASQRGDEATLGQIFGYRSWKRMTEKPVQLQYASEGG